MIIIERVKKIQRDMERAGFISAAEDFIERAMRDYTVREFERIERAWLAYSLKYG